MLYSGKYKFPDDSALHGTAQLDIGFSVPACVISAPSSIVLFFKLDKLESLDFIFNHDFLRSSYYQSPNEIQFVSEDAYLQIELNDMSHMADLSLTALDIDDQTAGWFRSFLHTVESGNGVHRYYRDRNLDRSQDVGLTLVFQRHVAHEEGEREEETSKLAFSPASVEAIVYFAKNQRKAASPQSRDAHCNESVHSSCGAEDAENHCFVDPIDPILTSILSGAPARASLFCETGETKDDAIINSLSFPIWLECILAECETCPSASDVTPGIFVLEAYVENGEIKVCTEQGTDLCMYEARRLVCCHAGVVLIHTDPETLQTNAVRCDALHLGHETLYTPHFNLTDSYLNSIQPHSPPYCDPCMPPLETQSEQMIRDLIHVIHNVRDDD